MRLIIISGLSGSGKSIALHTLEDLGCYCIDNLPIGLLQAFALLMLRDDAARNGNAAVGIDVRNQTLDLPKIPEIIGELKQTGIECEVIYLDADDETLIKRFSETRRKHPLTRQELSLSEAIQTERELLAAIRQIADLQLDTTHTNLHELRDLVVNHFEPDRRKRGPTLLLQSFGYKKGIPSDVEFMFDVRCLPNPYWDPALRQLSGRDEAVAAFLRRHPEVEAMQRDITAFFDQWLPRFGAGSRSYISIGIGCTGGQHRSVYLVEKLRAHFAAQDHKVIVRHRELR